MGLVPWWSVCQQGQGGTALPTVTVLGVPPNCAGSGIHWGQRSKARAKGDRAFLGYWEAWALLQPRFVFSGPLVDAAGRVWLGQHQLE